MVFSIYDGHPHGVLVLGVFLYGGLLAGAPLLVGTLFALYGYIGRINDIFFVLRINIATL